MPSDDRSPAGENVKTRYCGDLAELADLDVITRQLECPACYEVPLPPIFLCTAGHNICLSCKSQLDKCPLCKASFSTTRNFVMEGIVNTSKFNCNYKHHGCMDLILGEKFQEHLNSCIYRNGAISKKPQSSSTNANEESSSRPSVIVRPFGGCCQWIPSSTDDPIPEEAVEGGFEHGTLLYVSRSGFNGGCFPGKLNATTRQHFFPLALGTEACSNNAYEVLVAPADSVQWVTAEGGQIPPNPVIGGRTELGEALYIGRCGHGGTLIVGWILPSRKLVMSTYNNAVVTSAMFEVLVKTELGIALDLSAN